MLAKFGRPSHATVVAYMALFIALGGVSYAAVALPTNSVGTKQIKRGAVANSDLRKSSVTTDKVKNGSLLSRDFKPGQLVAGAPGVMGSPGLQGLKGDKGDSGANGTNGTNGTNDATKVVRRQTTALMLVGNSFYNTSVQCNPGEVATGGGVAHAELGNNAVVIADRPTGGSTTTAPTGWNGLIRNGDSTTDTFTVFVVCSTP